jgi:CheY-like chemotaxis protein
MINGIDRAKILVVDDDPDILQALTLILESQDYSVVGARNGLEALDRIESEKPDLMILDLLMPRMDGFAVYKRLQSLHRSNYRNMPIIILTSVREEASRRRYELETGRKLDVDEYMEKPFMPGDLLEKVGKLITRRRSPIS